MRKFNSKHKHHRLISVFLTVCLIISMSNMCLISANAATGTKASDAAIDLATLSAGAELSSGVYYLSESKTFGSTSTMNNGLKIKSGATVYIYVPEGVTLTAVGGGTNTARRQGGYAGILLPSGSTLIILGEGSVNATGGRAGNGESGGSGSKGTLSVGSYYYGGSGGSSTGSGATEYDGQENYCGSSGYSGGSGGSASSCGTLYVQDTISLTATGGTYGSRGTSGSAGSCTYSSSSWDDRKYHVAGGGGGGGGAGYSAYGIGTGGAAGGGGGSGGRGGIDYSKTSYGSPATYATQWY